MIKQFKKYLAIGTILSPLALTTHAADFWALGEATPDLFNNMSADGSKIALEKENPYPSSYYPSPDDGVNVVDLMFELYDISNPDDKNSSNQNLTMVYFSKPILL